jgi:protein-S-isoprenylcysteine O-methyltransferase Ste14
VFSQNPATSPLVFHQGLATTAFTASFCIWIALELVALWRMPKKRWQGAGVSEPLALIVFPWLGLWAGSLVAQVAPGIAITQSPVMVGAGVTVVSVGVVLRAWSVRTSQKRSDSQIAAPQGPYRFIRHPSYTASLVCALGFGLALANWVSIVVCVAVPLLAYVRRVRLEEALFKTKLGASYKPYASSTSRLLPRVW